MGVSLLILGAYFGVKAYFFRDGGESYLPVAKRKVSGFPVMRVGRPLTVTSLVGSGRGAVLVLVLSPDCTFCTQSAPFHRRLLAEAARYSIPSVIALPDAERGRRYLSGLGLYSNRVANWDQLGLRAVGTPTIVLADGGGLIRRIWAGRLEAASESVLLESLNDPGSIRVDVRKLNSGEAMLTGKAVRAIAATRAINIVYVGDRQTFRTENYSSAAVNIPLDELSSRASFELRRDVDQIVDCTDVFEPVCSISLETLSRLGFRAAAMDNSTGDFK
jgi:hypothetical protein